MKPFIKCRWCDKTYPIYEGEMTLVDTNSFIFHIEGFHPREMEAIGDVLNAVTEGWLAACVDLDVAPQAKLGEPEDEPA